MSEALIGGDQTAEGVSNPGTDGVVDGAEQDSQDEFINRIQSDREFAMEQISKRDRHSSELANRVKGLEPIEQLVNLAGGPQVLQELAQLGNAVRTTPGLHDVVLGAVNAGRYEPPSGAQDGQEDPDEWIDPDVKQAVDPLRAQIDELQSQVARLGQGLNATTVQSQDVKIRENIDDVLEDFKGNEEALAHATKTLNDSYANAFQAAKNGNAQQASMIDQLAQPGGKKVLRAVLNDVYREMAMGKASTPSGTQPGSNVVDMSKATDERNGNPSRPGSARLPIPPKGSRPSVNDFQKIMEAAARNKGLDPNSL